MLFRSAVDAVGAVVSTAPTAGAVDAVDVLDAVDAEAVPTAASGPAKAGMTNINASASVAFRDIVLRNFDECEPPNPLPRQEQHGGEYRLAEQYPQSLHKWRCEGHDQGEKDENQFVKARL